MCVPIDIRAYAKLHVVSQVCLRLLGKKPRELLWPFARRHLREEVTSGKKFVSFRHLGVEESPLIAFISLSINCQLDYNQSML